MRQFEEGDRVQLRNYNESSKWGFGRVHSKDSHLHYNVSTWMTDKHGGVIVDQMLRTKIRGEVSC